MMNTNDTHQVKELDITEKTITIENLFKDHIQQIRFDLAIQRGEAWNNKQKSLFIHTILVGFRYLLTDSFQNWIMDNPA